MKLTIKVVIIFLIFSNICFSQVNSEMSLNKLIEGNKRYVSGKLQHENQNAQRRTEVAKKQKPFAIILSCSDSRVPPEIIFDQGIGDLFVIRTAGNIVDNITIGSIEYAAEHLEVPLLVVLGHERCGAVEATVKGGEISGHIKSIVSNIARAVDKASNKKGDKLENSVIQNIHNVVDELTHSKPILEELIHEKKLKIIGARYDLDDGTVKFYNNPEHK